MADIVETVPFDFDDLYSALETKFEDAGYDIEPGSNTSQLITAMTYLTSMLNVNTAVNINETILPLSTKRDNALQDARVLGYETAHKQSYIYRLTLTLNEGGNYTIPKYTEFTADGKTYYYMGARMDLENMDPGQAIELDVKEGTLHKFENNSDTLVTTTTSITEANGDVVPQYYVDIPYIDVENTGIELFLTYYDDQGTLFKREQWYKSDQFMIDIDTVLNNEYIRLDNIDYKTPRLYFKFSGVGTDIRLGTVIEANVLTTSGTYGGISDISDAGIMKHSMDDDIDVSNISLILQGTDEEEIADIQQNAPLFHNSANRAVTKQDYVAICNRHQSIDTSMVWGGDDEYPKAPGHIWFSFLPSTNIRNHTETDEFKTKFILDDAEDLTNWFVENAEIRSVEYTESGQLISPGAWDVLDNYKIPTLEFHNRHPLYLDFEYDIEILKYNIKTSKADIHQEIFDVIDSCFKGTDEQLDLEDFEEDYFHSSIMKRIDQNLTDITGFNNAIRTKLMITEKNVAIENPNKAYRDIFFPMAIPFEDYFEEDGTLITDVLPSIDTSGFITGAYADMDVYADWSGISGDQSGTEVIYVPIRAKQVETQQIGASTDTIQLSSITMFPDDPSAETPTYDQVSLTVNGSTVPFTIIDEDTIELSSSIGSGDEVVVTVRNSIGTYYLFNSYKKFIMIQLYVNAAGYTDGSSYENLYSEPKSHLATEDIFYGFTTDNYYITTEGYAVVNDDNLDIITGSIVRQIVPELYTQSALTLEMFETVRYLDFNYASPNFTVSRNIIPRLKSVEFK